MDFIDQLKQFSTRAEKLRPQIQTEEATKTSLIMPFFQQVFGYDVFNPDEFLPEFDAKVSSSKKYEKVDYAICIDGEPVILIEAKWCGEPLDKHDSQLFHYFVATSAKFGILTNGIVYKFYTDLEEQNKMDMKPFLELDLLDIKETLVPELKRFCKSSFDASEIYNRASELKYSNEIKTYFSAQLQEPSDDFVKFIITPAYNGMKTAAIIEKFRPVVKNTLNNLIGEMMNDRISAALKKDNTPEPVAVSEASEAISAPEDDGSRNRVNTTDDELQGFYIVKAILADCVDVSKITYKDTLNYFSILYDGMVTRWICRLRMNGTKKSIGLPNETGEEVRQEISSSDDIFKFKDEIIASANRFFAMA